MLAPYGQKLADAWHARVLITIATVAPRDASGWQATAYHHGGHTLTTFGAYP